MSIRVVGIGQASVDHLAVVDRYPDPESKTELSGFSMQGGGTVANALATLAIFGVPTCFLGKVSDDDFGRFALRGLQDVKVDVSRVIEQPGRLSPFAFTLVERETRRRTVFFTGGNVDPIVSAELDLGVLSGTELLLLEGFHVEAEIRAAEEARRLGIRVVLDVATLREGMGELVALSDVLLASERYASEVAPRGEVEDSLIELSRMGPRVVVVTMGEEGSIGLEGDKLVHQPPFQVEVIDTTGAGDVYLGGYSYGLLQGWPLERCMQVASAAAGLSCRELGARAALPDLAEVEAVSWQEERTPAPE
jgi:sugar/nucleoside kinase (ribokinase family)